MSLGWKKFSFFDWEEQKEHVLPEDLSCSCSSSTQLFCGTISGQVGIVAHNKDSLTGKLHNKCEESVFW